MSVKLFRIRICYLFVLIFVSVNCPYSCYSQFDNDPSQRFNENLKRDEAIRALQGIEQELISANSREWHNQMLEESREREQIQLYMVASQAWYEAQATRMVAAQQLQMAANYIKQLEAMVKSHRKDVAALTAQNKKLSAQLKDAIRLVEAAPVGKSTPLPPSLYAAYANGDENGVQRLLHDYAVAQAAMLGETLPQRRKKEGIAAGNQAPSSPTKKSGNAPSEVASQGQDRSTSSKPFSKPENGASDLGGSDPRRVWRNESYNSQLERVDKDSWQEIDKVTGKVLWHYRELSRSSEYVELLLAERDQKMRFHHDKAELLKDGKWEWISNGKWQKPDMASQAGDRDASSNLAPKSEGGANQTNAGDSRKIWRNDSYNSQIEWVGTDKWNEIDNVTGQVRWHYREVARKDEYLELLLTERNQKIRFYRDKAELLKDGKWEWLSNGAWQP
jgi:hypothetical protein